MEKKIFPEGKQSRTESPKYGCSVYNEPDKRYQKDGCIVSYDNGLTHDPFPGKLEPIDTKFGKSVVFWPPSKCDDGVWRPLGIDECTYTWNVKKREYEGECEQCGKCCMMGGPNGDQPCKYLIKLDEKNEIVGNKMESSGSNEI